MTRIALFILAAMVVGCGTPAEDHGHGGDDHGHDHGEDETWAVTSWGEHFEIFAEAGALLMGHSSTSHTHVTILDGFQPLREGKVSAILRGADGQEFTFTQETPLRDGIFAISILPNVPGDYDLIFRVEAGGRSEDIASGRVQVGDHHAGSLLDSPAGESQGEEVGFLKEQQWRTTFATAWAESSSIRATVRGPGRVRPRAGGELVLSAPQDGLIGGESWPHAGKRVQPGDAVFTLVPLVSSDRSLAELESEATGLRSELETARDRLTRLEGLLKMEAASEAEVAAARNQVVALQSRLVAADNNLLTARGARKGTGPQGERVVLEAPFAGIVSSVLVTRGEVVTAGQALGRIVDPEPLWVEVALRPGDISRIRGDSFSLHIHGTGGLEGVSFPPDRVRFVSRSPEVDPATGTVALLLEVTGGEGDIVPGAAVTAEVGLADEWPGVVIAESAVVDDAGVPIVYVQNSGEAFVRREIQVLAREGERLLVSGIESGTRVVTEGSAAIRRASLMSSGETHGHVH